MNTVTGVGIDTTNIKKSLMSQNVNFKAEEALIEKDNEYDSFIKEQEKAKKQAKRDKNLSLGMQVGTFLAFVALAAVSIAAAFGKFNPAGFKKSNVEFKKYVNDSTLGDLKTTKTLQDDVRTMLLDMVESKDINPEFLELAGGSKQASPNAAILLGGSGTGKTESIKMKAKADGSELVIVKMSSFGNSYLNGNAISMAEMFKEFGRIFEKNPNKKYTILFDEGDALARKFKNVDANNNYLDKDRQSYITGLEDILKYKNVDVFMATNVPLEEIDEAVITRFGRNIKYNLPNEDQLFEGLKFHLRDIKGCTYDGLNFFEDKKDEIMKFVSNMVEKKCAFRDLKNVSTQAVENYKKDMKAQNKKLQFSAKYLEDALQTMGKSAGEMTESSERQYNLLDILSLLNK